MGAPRPETYCVHNRIAAVMAHTTRYAFKGQARLADDCGMSKSAINRLIAGKTNPSFEIVAAVMTALEKEIGKTLGVRELFSFDGTYPTASVCTLLACHGCLPDHAYYKDGRRVESFHDMKPGSWIGDSSMALGSKTLEEA